MKIFLTGATGYIGSSVAKRLANDGHTVYGLLRNVDKINDVKRLGVIPAVGTLDDAAILSRYARKVDAVIHTADSDHRFAIETIISALSGTGKVFIHTSGSSVVGDDVLGNFENPQIFDEKTPFVPMDIRRERVAINQYVRAAGESSNIRTIVIVPSMIYGDSLGLNVESDQLPKIYRKSLEKGKGVYVGAGINRWSNVHIADLVELYILALDKAPTASYFYAENGEASYKELAYYISKALGFGGQTESWPAGEALAELGDWARFALGSNSRVKARNARQILNWSPRQRSISHWILARK